MKNITFFTLLTLFVTGFQVASGQSTFTLLDSARITNPSCAVTDTGYTGTGYRFSFVAVQAQSPTLVPYVWYGTTYAERPMPKKLFVRMRAPLYVQGVVRAAVSLDRGGVGDTASSSQLVYIFPNSNWINYQFNLGPGSKTFSRLKISFSKVAGDSGLGVVFVDDIKADTSTIDDGGSSSAPIPTIPALSFPANLAVNVTSPAPMQWNASSGGTAYWLQVFNEDGSIFQDTTLSGTVCSLSGLQPGAKYTWRVLAQNSSGSSDWSDTWLFTVVSAASGKPNLLQPVNNATNQSKNPMFSWSTVSASVLYRIQVSTSSSFTSIAYERSLLSGTSHIASVALNPNTTYYWRVRGEGNSVGAWSAVSNFMTATLTSVAGDVTVPSELSLSQNYPNPFNPTTSIKFALPTAMSVTLTVFDLVGREVAELIPSSTMNVGSYSVAWNASSFSSGTYLYVLRAGSSVRTGRMVLLK